MTHDDTDRARFDASRDRPSATTRTTTLEQSAAPREGEVEVELADEAPISPLSAVPSEPAPEGDDDGPQTPTPKRGAHLRIVK